MSGLRRTLPEELRRRPSLRDSVRLSAGPKKTAFSTASTRRSPVCSAPFDVPHPTAAPALLSAIDVEIRAAIAAFSMRDPSASVPALARGLPATRIAIDTTERRARCGLHPEVKEQQFEDAINARARCRPPGNRAVAGPVVPGQRVGGCVADQQRIGRRFEDVSLELVASPGLAAGSRASVTGDSRLEQNATPQSPDVHGPGMRRR